MILATPLQIVLSIFLASILVVPVLVIGAKSIIRTYFTNKALMYGTIAKAAAAAIFDILDKKEKNNDSGSTSA